MAKTKTKKKTATKKTRIAPTKSIGRANYVVLDSRQSSPTKPKTRTVTKTVRVPGKTRTVVKTIVKRAKSTASSGFGVNKKEILTNSAFLIGGYLAGMAIANLAPLPEAIKNSRWKGAVFLVGGVLASVKIKDKRIRMASIGMATYGGVTLLVENVPQLSALRGMDSLSGDRRSVIGGTNQAVIGAPYRSGIKTPMY